jgi:hypothetical protein
MEIPSLRAFYVLDGNNNAGFYNEANPFNTNPLLVLGKNYALNFPSFEP